VEAVLDDVAGSGDEDAVDVRGADDELGLFSERALDRASKSPRDEMTTTTANSTATMIPNPYLNHRRLDRSAG